MLTLADQADVAPTTQALAASEEVQRTLNTLMDRWRELKEKDVKALNEQLEKATLSGISVEP